MLTHIALEHIWTKEVRTMPIEYFSERIISVRWGIAGLYDLNLKKNELRAQSVKARRKAGGMSFWRARDIDMIRAAIHKHYHPDDELKKAIKRHGENMPFKQTKMFP